MIVLQWLALGLIVLYVVAALVVTLWPSKRTPWYVVEEHERLREEMYFATFPVKAELCTRCRSGYHDGCRGGYCCCECEYGARR